MTAESSRRTDNPGRAGPPFTPSFTEFIKTSERRNDVIDEHARGEKVELELDSFVAKRDAQRRRTEGMLGDGLVARDLSGDAGRGEGVT